MPDADPHATPVGTYEDALQLVGVPSPVMEALFSVSPVRIAQFCMVIEDANPDHWDQAGSAERWGKAISPPAMLQSWLQPLPWHPDKPTRLESCAMTLPLPGSSLINVSTDTVYHRPIHVSDRLSFTDRVTALSEAKTTRLGTGHFVTTVADFVDQDGAPVATCTNIMFRFTPAEA